MMRLRLLDLHRLLPVGVSAVLTAGGLAAQAPDRWQLSWSSNAYRMVDNQRVPVGTETYILSLKATVGDSVIATLTTANPAIVDTLDGVMSARQLSLRSRAREIMVQGPTGTGAPPGVTSLMLLTMELRGEEGTGTMTRQITGIPGVQVPPTSVAVSAKKLPASGDSR